MLRLTSNSSGSFRGALPNKHHINQLAIVGKSGCCYLRHKFLNQSKMTFYNVLRLVLAIILMALTTEVQGKSYVAAVVEYIAVGDPLGRDDPVNVLHMNALNYENYIRDAGSMGVDIIVFPECGLSTIKIPESRAEVLPFLTKFPRPEDHENPCTSTTAETPEVLKILSCAAREAGIYVVVNLPEIMHCSSEEDSSCPSDGAFFFNSNIVFDRNGTLIARCRKVNLFREPAFNVPSPPELCTFDTDFGVKFGTFICFDIYFDFPARKLVEMTNITDVVYPTAWFSEYPFLTATQAQMAWSYAMNRTLLASGYDLPSNRNGGSGIYAGHNGALEVIMPLNATSRMLVQRVAKTNTNHEEKLAAIHSSRQELIFYRNPYLSSYTTELINLQPGQATNVSLCNRGLCCSFDLKISETNVHGSVEQSYYRLAVFDGVRGFLVARTGGIQVCALVACSDSEVESCGIAPTTDGRIKFEHVNINGQFAGTGDVTVMPTTLYLRSYLPIQTQKFDFNASRNLNEHQIVHMSTVSEIESVATFGIYARVYDRDGSPVTSD